MENLVHLFCTFYQYIQHIHLQMGTKEMQECVKCYLPGLTTVTTNVKSLLVIIKGKHNYNQPEGTTASF
jgi:hypothetical protein